MRTAFAVILKRDLRIALRRSAEMINPLLFFVLVVSLFPLAVSPDPAVLARLAPGVLWVAALLATLLSLDGVFRSDYEDGSLDRMLVSPRPLSMLVAAKVLAHWLVSGLPLVLAAPLLAVLLALPASAVALLVAALLLGTPTLSLVGAIGAALTVGLRRGGVLLPLLLLPLYVPVLVFGSGAVQAALSGVGGAAHLYMLGALFALALALAPFATAAALRVAAT